MNFEYKLIRSRRRSVCLSIRNGELIVLAPPLTPVIFINRFVRSKSDWIEKHLKKSQAVFKRQYKAGEIFLYLGRELELKIIKTSLSSRAESRDLEKQAYPKTRSLHAGRDDIVGVAATSNDLVVKTYDDSKKFLKLTLERFYKDRTRELVLKLIKKYEPNFTGSTTIKPYKSKWGSCTGKNDLSFNSKLAMTPIAVVEYVVIHELCHIKQKNHSKHFWTLVGSIDEEYNKKRKWLRANHDKLII